MSIARYIWASPNTLLGLLFWPSVLVTRGEIRIVDGVLEIHGVFIAWFLRHCVLVAGGATAMTLGHVVLGCDQRTLSLTRVHERVHVRQYERWGPAFIPAYVLASIWGLTTRAGPYYGNVFEQEAMRIERATGSTRWSV